MPPVPVLIFEAFLFGAVIGSFLNVCIYRIPLGMTLGGRSFCPQCQTKVAWYDNIPIFGYLFLLGRCRQCRKPISARYPLVELITALLSLAAFMKSPSLPIYFFWFCFFVAPLIVITFIDIDHQIIPDVISIPGIPIGILVILFQKWPDWSGGLIHSIAGALVGGGSLIVIGTLYQWIRKREGLGGGDVKLCGMLGAFLGWQGMIFVFFVSSVLGTLYIVFYGLWMIVKRKSRLQEGPMIIPFGPFLAGGALIFYFFGPAILEWYGALSGLTLDYSI